MQVGPQDPSQGILDFPKALTRFELRRFEPAAELAAWIESYWQVSWNLPDGETHRQTNVAHAAVNVTVEKGQPWLYGVPGQTFIRDLSGQDWVWGVKFRPGAFAEFQDEPIAKLTGHRLLVPETSARAWAEAVTKAVSDDQRRNHSDAFWQQLARERRLIGADLPSRPSEATLIAEKIISDRSILKVSDAVTLAGVAERSLQRLFRRAIGIAPKDFIRRYRLQEAAERLLREPETPSSLVALGVGYYDQAHFIRDFRSVVGVSPEVYRRRQGGAKA